MSNQGLYPRQCALNTLVAIFDKGTSLDYNLDKFAKKYDLSARDKSFAHALCGFVLRYYDVLQSCVNKTANRNKNIAPSHLNALLLMGAAQIYFMDSVPDHAAVDSTVELSKIIKCSKQSGMVNAVLRRLIREGVMDDLSPSLPHWMIKSWEQDYDVDIAKQIEISSLTQAKTGVSHKNGSWRLLDDGEDLILSPDEWVQDYASHLPVSLLGDLNGARVLDLCAAPGGKTMQLAAKGAHVTAIDVSEKRLTRLYDNLERTQLSDTVDVICADILKWLPKDNMQYDVVLLDAPCSATGTIRRHPDLPFIRDQKGIQSLVSLQQNLLNHIKDWVKDDGRIVYCTCSIQKDEGEHQVDRFLNKNSDFKRDDKITHKYKTDQGDVRLLPHYGDMDGFFISVLNKS